MFGLAWDSVGRMSPRKPLSTDSGTIRLTFRLTQEEADWIDARRGAQSRSGFVRGLLGPEPEPEPVVEPKPAPAQAQTQRHLHRFVKGQVTGYLKGAPVHEWACACGVSKVE
jgi:hypothetical protein